MAWYVGADPASVKAGLAAISESGEIHTFATNLRGTMPERLAALRRETLAFLAPIVDDGAWCAVIERPGTRHGGATLLGAYGVIVEAFQSSLKCPVLTLASAEWKRHAIGKGNAKDRDIDVAARLLGYTGASHDVAVAVCCADAARTLTKREYPEAA